MHRFAKAISLALFACCLVAAQANEIPAKAETALPKGTDVCIKSVSEPKVSAQNYDFGTCIGAKFGVYIKISDQSFIDLGVGTVDMGKSKCVDINNSKPLLTVNFACGVLTFEFQKDEKSNYVSSFSGQYSVQENAKVDFKNTDKLFAVSSDNYYKCDAKQEVLVGVQDSTQKPSVVFQDLVLNAFKDESKTEQTCEMDSQSGVAWWIYALAFLAIILVAYFVVRLVGRKSSASSSY